MAAEREGPHVAVSVTDEGRGVPPDLLPHLFRKHARVGGGRELGIRGSGLGLAICKGLVEAHGGRIRAESGGVGLGTRFTFTLPAAAGTGSGAASGPARSSGGSPAEARGRTRVLVVDDDPQTLKYVRDALALPGYTTLSTVDPQEVSRLLETQRPHLVLLDLLMPGTDGIELMDQVPGLADQPVIFISGYGRDETIARAHCGREPPTTSSSRFRRRSWWRGSRRPCAAGAGCPTRSCWASWPSATGNAT